MLSILFGVFSICLQSLVIILSLLATFILNTLFRFLFTEKEKTILKKAFSTYLSKDVVNQIIKDPSKLALGGDEKNITFLFTDIESFSTLSEMITPTEVVSLLNKYLTALSDIVLTEQGTIDKSIGDAIVSFFGAPIEYENHAERALTVAICMKQADAILNKELLANNESPMPLLTHIAINTGKMVVGNMGTDTKMNYTIMGNDVNLTSRLEGVNKVYGTWILATEKTFFEGGQNILGRKLDKVRVLGINTPIQIYNILGFKNEISSEMKTGIEKFHTALDTYCNKDMKKTLTLFTEVHLHLPNDPPTQLYIQRCKKYIAEGLPTDWTGIVNLMTK